MEKMEFGKTKKFYADSSWIDLLTKFLIEKNI